MMGRGQIAFCLVALLAAALSSGCANGNKPAPSPSPPPQGELPAALDPCAERLHEISGALLLFYAQKYRLPETLGELPPLKSGELAALNCPVSQKPYIYDPQGVRAEKMPGRLIIYDADPAHNGMRWAIMAEGVDTGPLIARVIKVPETVFHQPRPAPAAQP